MKLCLTMRFAFTNFIRSVEPGEPFPPGFDEAWTKLRDALTSELRKRSLWNAPPSYLGICGFRRWSEPGALDELAADCFTAVIIRRLPAMKALLEDMENVEGLVFRNLRNFLHDTQKKHNPLDYRVFEVLRAAVRRLIEDETLHVLDGDPGVRNATVLAFSPASDPRGASGTQIGEQVREWGDDLLPELVTARPAEVDRVEARVGVHLLRLEAQGVDVFRFRDVLEPLRSDLRGRWSAFWQQTEGETAMADARDEPVLLVRLAPPDAGFEERQLFDQLLICVATGLERRENPRTRAYLEKLWTFFRAQTEEDTTLEASALPSRRRIAELLGIPRYRFPELYEILREEVEKCRAAVRLPLPAARRESATRTRDHAIR